MKEKSPESIVLRFVWLENLTQDYTNEEIGRIVRDLYGYARNGTIPSQYLDRGMRGLWRSMKDGVDKDFSKYREKSKKNSEAAKARWVKQMQKDDVPVVQTDTNALCEMRTHTVASNCIHSHPTNTNTDTSTDTSTATVTDVNAGRGWLVNLDSLARYFEQGDPPPTEQSQTAHGVRQIG